LERVCRAQGEIRVMRAVVGMELDARAAKEAAIRSEETAAAAEEVTAKRTREIIEDDDDDEDEVAGAPLRTRMRLCVEGCDGSSVSVC